MSTYIIKRILLMIPTLLGITFLSYVIIRNAPGNPVSAEADDMKGAKQNQFMSEKGDYQKLLHLDKNPAVAYFYWAADFFNPEKNVSSKHKTSVFKIILERLPNSLVLNLYAVIVLYLLGLPLGIDSAIHAGQTRERVITVLLFLLYSLPSFWVGLNLIVFFGRGGHLLKWLPTVAGSLRWIVLASAALILAERFLCADSRPSLRDSHEPNPGRRWAGLAAGGIGWSGAILCVFGVLAMLAFKFGNDVSWGAMAGLAFLGEWPQNLSAYGLPIAGLEPDNADRLHYLALLKASVPYYLMPVFCLTYSGFAGESRFMRVGLMEILSQDYIRTAKAKGLRDWQVIGRHAIPNALTPIVVSLAGLLPGLIGGSVIIETIFSVPGTGLLFYEAIQSRDYNLIMAETTLSAVLVLFGILISDLLLPTLDPRVTFEGRDA